MNWFAWELAGLIVVVLASALGLAPSSHILRPVRRRWAALGNRKRLCVLLSTTLGFGVSAAASAVRIPAPTVHDEFSYLLAADTFAHGRVTNPTHPHWQHFESFHIIHQPTYASKYPPAQGLILAVGTVLGGHPIVGVWISMGLAAGSLCWMLQGWMPGRWALFGAMVFALHPSLQFSSFFSWGYSYWGGAVPMIGGAWLFGALPRLLRGIPGYAGVMLALGVVVLANSRPYEGLAACLTVLLAFAWELLAGRLSLANLLGKAVLPAALVILPATVVMHNYNLRVTGSATRLPYQLHEEMYGACPLFLVLGLPPEPEYRHSVMRRFHLEWGLNSYLQQRDLQGWLRTKTALAGALWSFFCGPTLTIPLLPGVYMLGRRDMRFAISALALCAVASAIVPWMQPHYLAPSVPLLWLLLVQGWRRLRIGWGPMRHFNRRLALGLFLLLMTLFTAKLAGHWTKKPLGWQWQRRAIEERLTATPGEHLVFVNYSPGHNPLHEWVYNKAEIDAAKTVWARIMSPQENGRLIDYFAGRRVWIVDADARQPRLREWQKEPTQM